MTNMWKYLFIVVFALHLSSYLAEGGTTQASTTEMTPGSKSGSHLPPESVSEPSSLAKDGTSEALTSEMTPGQMSDSSSDLPTKSDSEPSTDPHQTTESATTRPDATSTPKCNKQRNNDKHHGGQHRKFAEEDFSVTSKLFGFDNRRLFKRSSGSKTRYNYTLDKLERYFDSKSLKINHLDIVKANGSASDFIVNIDGEITIDVDDSFVITSAVYRGDDMQSEMKKIVDLPHTSFCDYSRTMYKELFYDTLKDHSNFPHYDQCPWKKLKFWIKDYHYDMNSFDMQPGYYRIETYLMKNDKIIEDTIVWLGVSPLSY